MSTRIDETLQKVGLTKNETVVYLALLKLGPSSVSAIAERSGLYRPYVYDTIQRLEEKGLASCAMSGGKKIFSATHPRHLVTMEEERINELQRHVRELEQSMIRPKGASAAETYTGKRVVRVVQRDVIETLRKSGGESLVTGVDERLFAATDETTMEQFFAQLRRYKLRERVLLRAGDSERPASQATTKYRYLPDKYFTPNATFVYGHTVAIIIFTEPLHGIIIRSEALAQTYRKQFELLWKIARAK